MMRVARRRSRAWSAGECAGAIAAWRWRALVRFVAATVALTGTKTVSAGPYAVGDAITYTIVLTNNGNTASPDNVGNEFVDTLPASLTLVSANATSGTAAANIGLKQVTWNGTISGSGGTVTITINATINNSGVITNQGTFCFDADLTGDNETCQTTDPQGGTTITVPASAVEQVPTTSELGLLLLAMGLALLAAWKISNMRLMPRPPQPTPALGPPASTQSMPRCERMRSMSCTRSHVVLLRRSACGVLRPQPR